MIFSNFRDTYRLWWQKPRATKDFLAEREVSFLELFYDLVYVVLIAEVAHHLTHHLSWKGAGEFGLMMMFVMWTWLNGMFYHSLHGNNDISIRIFTFAQMFLVGGMTIFIGDIFEPGSNPGFAITFASFQLLFAVLWFRTGYHDVEHRPISYPFVILYVLSGAAMLATAGIESPLNYQIWTGIVAFNVVIPLIGWLLPKSRPVAEQSSVHGLDSVERFGLITIVALGEVIVSSINGLGELEEFTFRNGLIGALGTAIAIAIWWLYFDFISRRTPLDGFWNHQLYTYFHIPLVIGIAATGAVLRELIVHNENEMESTARWLFVSSAAASILTISALVRLVSQPNQEIQDFMRRSIPLMTICAAAIVGLGFTSLGHIGLLAAVLSILLVTVVYAVASWIKVAARGLETLEPGQPALE